MFAVLSVHHVSVCYTYAATFKMILQANQYSACTLEGTLQGFVAGTLCTALLKERSKSYSFEGDLTAGQIQPPKE